MREVRNKNGKTQLFYYCEMGMTASVVRMLGMTSIDVEGRRDGGLWDGRRGGEEDGYTCLMIAAYNGHLDICRLLVDKGAQVTVKDRTGWTPLHCAAEQGHVEIVRLLCDHGAYVEARADRIWSSTGWTPLHYAAEQGHVEIVRLLCNHGADFEARADRGWRPLHRAACTVRTSVVKELIEVRNADVNARTDGGGTALGWTRNRSQPDIAAYLISHGGID